MIGYYLIYYLINIKKISFYENFKLNCFCYFFYKLKCELYCLNVFKERNVLNVFFCCFLNLILGLLYNIF